MGGSIVADEALKAGDVDFRPQLTSIKEASPDVIIMPLMFKEVALSATQARDLGYHRNDVRRRWMAFLAAA